MTESRCQSRNYEFPVLWWHTMCKSYMKIEVFKGAVAYIFMFFVLIGVEVNMNYLRMYDAVWSNFIPQNHHLFHNIQHHGWYPAAAFIPHSQNYAVKWDTAHLLFSLCLVNHLEKIGFCLLKCCKLFLVTVCPVLHPKSVAALLPLPPLPLHHPHLRPCLLICYMNSLTCADCVPHHS